MARQFSFRRNEFNRPPREWNLLPADTVKVLEPPQFPSPPQPINRLMILMPAFMMAVPGIANLAAAANSNNPNLVTSLLPFVMAGVYPSLMWFNQRSQKKAWEKTTTQLEQDFKAELNEMRGRLDQLQRLQYENAWKTNPLVDTLSDRASQRDPHLWERRPGHADFLALRLGTYEGPSSYTITFHDLDTRDEHKKQANVIAQPYATVPQLPCQVNLTEIGSLGLAGKLRDRLVRTLICNLVVHHAPAEVHLYAIYQARYEAGSDSAPRSTKWGWLKWLPHTRLKPDVPQVANTPAGIGKLMSSLLDELHKREQLLRNSAEKKDEDWPYIVILVKDPELAHGQEAINLILKRGPELRASAIFLASDSRDLPGGCGAWIELVSDEFTLKTAQPGVAPIRGQAEFTDASLAERIARSLAPLTPRSEEGEDLPAGVRFSSLFEATSARHLNLLKIWNDHRDPNRQLVVPIGSAIGNRLLNLDLHSTAHGTHGLIAGTTGAGKTVLLATVIASLATCNSPRLVNFVIIDMKGDKNLDLLSRLPHTVGFASVLNKSMGEGRMRSYIARAIVALESEISRRMDILSRGNASDIFEYNRQNLQQPLPHLIVIIDEFAVLRKQYSELMDKLVDVSALGRAPGVHLILCTQSPGGGTVSDKIWANTQFRICLRVANTDESRSILHLQDAAFLPVKPPGRAYLQASGGEVEIFEQFQVAWAEGRVSTPEEEKAVAEEFEIAEIYPDGSRQSLYKHEPAVRSQQERDTRPTELEYIVEQAQIMAQKDGLSLPLRGPWLPPLPEVITLDGLLQSHKSYRKWEHTTWTSPTTDGWLSVPIGMIDEPAGQRQIPLVIDLAREHVHLWIGGVLSSGKSTALRTLIMALAQTHSPADVHFYLLAFGQRALMPFRRLPHVGALIHLSEIERLQRLMTWLEREVERRRGLLNEKSVDSIDAYRQVTQQAVPSLVVVVENFGELVKEASRTTELQDVLDKLSQLLSTSTGCDLHFIFSTTAPNLRGEMAANVNGRLALRFQTRADAHDLLAVRSPIALDDIAGRGLWKAGNDAFECQVAMPVNALDDANQGKMLSALSEEMRNAWPGALPQPIGTLPKHVRLSEVLTLSADQDWLTMPGEDKLPVILGMDDDLLPVTIDLIGQGPSLLFVGAPKSGKTTLLETLAVSLAACYSPRVVQIYGIDVRRSALSKTLQTLVNTRGVADNGERAVALLDQIQAEITARLERQKAQAVDLPPALAWPRLVLLVDDLSRQMTDRDTDIFDRLNVCLKQGEAVGFQLIIAGDGNNLSPMMNPFMQQLKAGQRGLIFSAANDNASVLNARVPRLKAAITGRGHWVQAGTPRLLQIAQYDADNADLRRWMAGRATALEVAEAAQQAAQNPTEPPVLTETTRDPDLDQPAAGA